MKKFADKKVSEKKKRNQMNEVMHNKKRTENAKGDMRKNDTKRN